VKILSAEFVLSAGHVSECPDVAVPEIAMSGRSNVGKSSLLNALLGRRALAKVSGTPGKTQRLNFFVVNERFHLVDLPGYGYAKASGAARNQWSRMMQQYLRTRRQLVGVLQLVDCRHDPSREDREMIEWLVLERIPFCLVGTKADKIAPSKRRAAMRRIADTLDLPPDQAVVATSSETGDGRPELLGWVGALLQAVE
jgi:GTP-binding protein